MTLRKYVEMLEDVHQEVGLAMVPLMALFGLVMMIGLLPLNTLGWLVMRACRLYRQSEDWRERKAAA